MITVKQILDLIDFPDEQKVTLYDYDVWDIVCNSLADEIPNHYFDRIVKGIEIGSDVLMLNLESTK